MTMQFQGFKPEAQKRIANTLGYNGDMSEFNGYLMQNPKAKQKMDMYNQQAVKMMQGGMVRRNYAEGGYAGPTGTFRPTQNFDMKSGQLLSADSNSNELGRTTSGDILVYEGFSNYGYGNPLTGPKYSVIAPYGSDKVSFSSFQDAMKSVNPRYIKDDTPEYRTPKELFRIDKSKLQNDLDTGKISNEEFNNIYTGKFENFEQFQNSGSPVYDQAAVDAVTQPTQQPAPVRPPRPENPTTMPTQPMPEISPPPLAGGAPQYPGSVPPVTTMPIKDDDLLYKPVLDPLRPPETSPGGPSPRPITTPVAGPTLTTKDDTVNRQVNTSDRTGADQSIPTATPSTSLTDNTSLENTNTGEATTIADVSAGRVLTPELPTGGAVEAVGTSVTGQQIVDNTSGAVSGNINTQVQQAAPSGTAIAAPTSIAGGPATINEETISKIAGEDLEKVLDNTGVAKGSIDPRAVIDAPTDTTTEVSKLKGAEGTSVDIVAPVERKIEANELISGAVDVGKAAKFIEQIQAETATPSVKATVKGQLEELMADFDGGETPAWASGAMRNVASQMAARGLSASSIAGQAMVQAAMESALPIASADAATFASFETQNLSNRQARAMLAAEQRAKFIGQEFDQAFQARVNNSAKISDIANLNFTAEQQIALENSRAANTMSINNLSNDQAVIIAEAAALSRLELANLDNKMQAVVQNSKNLIDMDMTNLSIKQADNVFKAQQRVAAIFSDAASVNAAKQFNATSKNQTDQFFANLKTQNSQFNVAQTNAINTFNAGDVNAQSRFTSEMMNQREQFNAQNKLVVEQSNAVWRREIGTADTAAINRTNELNANAMLNISDTAYNNMWQYYADTMENAYTAANNERDRMTKLAVAKLQVDSEFDIAKWQADAASTAAIGQAIVQIATSSTAMDTLGDAWNWITTPGT